jgi:hypothetical protein
VDRVLGSASSRKAPEGEGRNCPAGEQQDCVTLVPPAYNGGDGEDHRDWLVNEERHQKELDRLTAAFG